MCRVVQLSVAPLLGTRAVMGKDAVVLSLAWKGTQKLIEDQRVEFIPEPAGIDDTMLALVKYPVPTGKLVADASLAAFGIASSRVLITLDRGFRQFKGLDVRILSPDNV
jgi:predicted nucleic acid-binding protein